MVTMIGVIYVIKYVRDYVYVYLVYVWYCLS